MEMHWSKPVEIALTLILTILPWTWPNMPVVARCVLWGIAWLLLLHLGFAVVPQLAHLSIVVKVALVVGPTGFLVAGTYSPILSMWRGEKASALTGKLTPRKQYRKVGGDVIFQIGRNAKAQIRWTGAKNTPQFAALGSHIELDRNEYGDLVVDTLIKDRDGNLIVEIVDNVWRVSNAAWEKNYTDNALEVKDAQGRVVFQLRLRDIAEIQAEWWDKDGKGFRVVQVKDRPDSPDSGPKGFVIVLMTPVYHPDDPAIEPIFK